MTKETFNKLISSVRRTDETLNALSALKIDIAELDMINDIWNVQDALILEILNETQADYLNWWMYESKMGEREYPYFFKDKQLYTGIDANIVYETMMGLWKELKLK